MTLSEKSTVATTCTCCASSPSIYQVDAAERKYTEQFLETTKAQTAEKSTSLTPFQEFYHENPRAGYAFQKLHEAFKHIDGFLQPDANKPEHQDPWAYFLDVEAHVAFCSSIQELIESMDRSRWLYHEPGLVEKIRAADNVRLRRQMHYRLSDCASDWEPEAYDRLCDRYSVLEKFRGVFRRERDRKAVELRVELSEGTGGRSAEEKLLVNDIRRMKPGKWYVWNRSNPMYLKIFGKRIVRVGTIGVP